MRFTLTWGLGGMAALMVMQQMVTGLLLGLFYTPLPVQAYESVQHIQNTVFLGRLVRNMHHWTGHALVIVLFLHLLRIFLDGAFYPPRHRSWFVGLALGVLILMANFSGYLLPWEQLSYWAVTIATSMVSYIPFIGISLQGKRRVVRRLVLRIFSCFTSFIPVLFRFLFSCLWVIISGLYEKQEVFSFPAKSCQPN